MSIMTNSSFPKEWQDSIMSVGLWANFLKRTGQIVYNPRHAPVAQWIERLTSERQVQKQAHALYTAYILS
jgi:hypothetical protein